MKQTLLSLFFFLVLCQTNVNAQGETTVGLLTYQMPYTYEGYTLIYPHNQPNVYLLNLCGEIVHTWTDEVNFRPGNVAYLREDGSIVKTKRDMLITDDAIWAGGGGEIVEIRSWDNELLWSYSLNNADFRLHHDIAPMPNGNILLLSWERKTGGEAQAAGRLPELLAQTDLWSEYVFEFNPDTDEIVWEWHAWDHIVQNVDAEKPNFGVVSENPRLINLNYDNNEAKADWMHTNAMDYNPTLDQIMLSIPTFDEIWIIDHTTTTEQAAGHVGGFTNHGGDLIYRVGNPATYDRGDAGERILFYQHDAHWANKFLPASHPNAGDIVVFNNRIGEDFSTIETFTSSWEMYSGDYETFNGAFFPVVFDNTITHPTPQSLYSTGLSSAQLLPNGNILACSGRHGYIVEMTANNDVVWEYKTPIMGGQAVDQGTILEINNNLTFRAFRYPTDYSAFDNRNLEPKGWIETNPTEDYCQRLVSTSMPDIYNFGVYPNPATDRVQITWDTGTKINLKVTDILGRTVLTDKGIGGMMYLDISTLESNLYFIEIEDLAVLKLVIER
ncbi:MAG: hypothetical protein ACI85O_002175 [Saprospiraceae bacterium]|jgi:hypothetical protein